MKNSFMQMQDLKFFNQLDEIKNQYARKTKIIEDLKKENEKLKEENYKDEELSRMKNRLKELEGDCYRGFPITKEEKEKIDQWIINHENTYHGGFPSYHGAAGGGYSYTFSPTGIGTFGTCICESCRLKAQKDAKEDRKKYQELLRQYDATYTFQDII